MAHRCQAVLSEWNGMQARKNILHVMSTTWLLLTLDMESYFRDVTLALKGPMSTARKLSVIFTRKSSLIGRNSNLWNREAANIKRSALASDSPTHTRGPIEKGMNLYGWYWNFPLESSQRSGLNVSGSSKLAGSRCTPWTWIITMLSFGMSKFPKNVTANAAKFLTTNVAKYGQGPSLAKQS